MSRYIDADKIPYVISEDGCLDDFAYRYDINEVPTADVVEVRHGEWAVKDLNNSLYESKKAPHCSVCNYMSFIRYDYCPNCGAKMDGERREEK